MASSQTRSLSVGACNAVSVARVSTVVPPSALRTSLGESPASVRLGHDSRAALVVGTKDRNCRACSRFQCL